MSDDHIGVSEIQWAGWSRNFFDSLNDGGVWAVPEAGLIFRREGEKLVLFRRMPWLPEMAEAAVPLSAEDLRAYQDDYYEMMRRHFKAADIELEDWT